jgi:hypothetical protein
VIPIADSMSAFMRELGLGVTGGLKGGIGRFKDQLNRLAAARLQIIWAGEDRGSTVNTSPFRRLDVWFPADHRQRVLWPSEIELSAEFYADLKDHALPLDPRGLRALQHNARALDLYTWFAHRLPRACSRTGDFAGRVPGNQSRASTGDGHRRPRLRAGLGERRGATHFGIEQCRHDGERPSGIWREALILVTVESYKRGISLSIRW